MINENNVSEEVKEGVENLTREDLLEIWKGIRPLHIPYGIFKSIQKAYVSINKERKRGTMHFVSNGFIVKDGDKEVVKYAHKGVTYKKPIEIKKEE